MRRLTRTIGGAALAVLALSGCQDEDGPDPAADAPRAERGAALIEEVGCGACHMIPGVRSAQGLVGPPLDHMSRRVFIAGLLRNNPENMAAWLREPQRYVPGNAMPDMGLTEEQARDIAAYLYTLE